MTIYLLNKALRCDLHVTYFLPNNHLWVKIYLKINIYFFSPSCVLMPVALMVLFDKMKVNKKHFPGEGTL